jgi:probable HAF family extracellular repeat protein
MKKLLISTTLLVVTSSSAFAYDLIDLGANVEPKAINNTGVVVGSKNTDQYPAVAFSWSSGKGFEIIDGISANAVNDNGQIAGTTITGAFYLDGNVYRDWSDYGALGMNQWGMVAGYSVGSNPYQSRSLPYNPAIFDGINWNVYDIAGIYSRGTRKGIYADRFILNGINSSGYSVGFKYRYGLVGTSAILIDPNVTVQSSADVTYLSIPYGGKAADINNSNMIVGTTGSSSSTVPVTYSRAFILDYGMNSISILPVLDGGLRSSASDINEYNQVVGSSETLTGANIVNHAFLWNQADGITVDLNDWATNGWTLTAATAINDNGDIVGYGNLNGVEHGFLLTNAPPSSMQNLPPKAVASADAHSGRAPLAVRFDSSASSDPDGTLVGYSWDFQDGTSSTAANPSHVFTDPGIYSVTLTVTDDQGMQSSDSITITVKRGRRR